MSVYTFAFILCLLVAVVPYWTGATRATPIVTTQPNAQLNQTTSPDPRGTRSAGGQRRCSVQVCVQQQIQGTCVRFGDKRQGVPACSAGQYLDIQSDQCT